MKSIALVIEKRKGNILSARAEFPVGEYKKIARYSCNIDFAFPKGRCDMHKINVDRSKGDIHNLAGNRLVRPSYNAAFWAFAALPLIRTLLVESSLPL